MRISRDALGLGLAFLWSQRGTCARRNVGCVLFDLDGYQLSAGYNGPASQQQHCTDATPCPGRGSPSGQGLELCEAIHAEQNALLRCPDVRLIHACFVTHSPCVHCVKLLMNTECRRIVFAERYSHDVPARDLWLRSSSRWRERTWEQGVGDGG